MLIKRYRAAAAAAVAAFAVAGVLGVASPAQAVGGTCTASKEKQSGLDNFRGKAQCSRLDGDSKARPKLIRDGGPDYTGPYFTALNKSYYTSYYSCWMGCDGAYEIAHV